MTDALEEDIGISLFARGHWQDNYVDVQAINDGQIHSAQLQPSSFLDVLDKIDGSCDWEEFCLLVITVLTH